jgi:hypothetical protein
MTTAAAPPAMPRAGTGPAPKISSGETGIRTTAPAVVTVAGKAMLPVPRITAASELNGQSGTAPAKIKVE